MKNQEPTSRRPTVPVAGGWHFHWGWAFALALCLGFVAIFGLLDMSGPNAGGMQHEHPLGSYHVSLLLLVAALALVFLDFIFGRAKGR